MKRTKPEWSASPRMRPRACRQSTAPILYTQRQEKFFLNNLSWQSRKYAPYWDFRPARLNANSPSWSNRVSSPLRVGPEERHTGCHKTRPINVFFRLRLAPHEERVTCLTRWLRLRLHRKESLSFSFSYRSMPVCISSYAYRHTSSFFSV